MLILKRLFILFGFSLLTACGGSGGGGTSPSIPEDAATITAANADSIAQSAVGTIDSISTTVSVDAVSLPSIRNATETLTEFVFDRNRHGVAIVSGVTVTDSCPSGGSATDEYTETPTSESGTVTFDNCGLSSDFFVNGSFSYSSTWDNSTGDYSISGNGSIAYAISGLNFTVAMDYSETGNDVSGAFSTTISYSVSGVPGGGFLVETTSPLVGTGTVVTSGQIIVSGAAGTRLRITITSANSATVELDDGSGTFVPFSTISI